MNAVVLKNLTKRYKEIPAVDRISFEVGEGEFFALLGENGAGKSTTVNILCTILEKSDGQVEILGHDLGKENDRIRRNIGIVFQSSVLDDKLTVKENLFTRGAYYGFSGKEIKRRLEPLMEGFELAEILNRAYGKLSGGQRRRVDIIRALLHEPKILFLDEPTTGLDPLSRKTVWDYISHLRKERKITVFLTTHYMEEVANADNVVILDKGRVLAKDTPAGLKNKYTYAKLIWYGAGESEAKQILKEAGLSYEVEANRVKVKIKKEKFDLTAFLYQHRNLIRDYEVIKGSMDDVFLNLTGRKLGEMA